MLVLKRVLLSTQIISLYWGAWWLSGRVFDLRSKGGWFKTHQRHCIVSLNKTLYPLLSTHAYQTLRSCTSGWILKTIPPRKESKIGKCHATDYAFLSLWFKFEVRKYSRFVRFTFARKIGVPEFDRNVFIA